MRILRIDECGDLESLRDELGWDFWLEEGPVEEVRSIIARVRDEGDTALLDLTRRFDGVDPSRTMIAFPHPRCDQGCT